MLSENLILAHPGLVSVSVYQALVRFAQQANLLSPVPIQICSDRPQQLPGRWEMANGVLQGFGRDEVLVEVSIVEELAFHAAELTGKVEMDSSLLYPMMMALPTGDLPQVMPQALNLAQLNCMRMLAVFKFLKRNDGASAKEVWFFANFLEEVTGTLDIRFGGDQSVIQLLVGDDAMAELRF